MPATNRALETTPKQRLALIGALVAASAALGACGNNQVPARSATDPTPTVSSTAPASDTPPTEASTEATPSSGPSASTTATPPDLPNLDFPTDWTAVYLTRDCSMFDTIDTTALIPDAERWESFALTQDEIIECSLRRKDEKYPAIAIGVVPPGGLRGEFPSQDGFIAFFLKNGIDGYNARPAPVAGPWDFGVYDRLRNSGITSPEFMGRLTYATDDTPRSATVYCKLTLDETPVDVDLEDPDLRDKLEPITDAVVPYTDDFISVCTDALKLTSYPMGAVE